MGKIVTVGYGHLTDMIHDARSAHEEIENEHAETHTKHDARFIGERGAMLRAIAIMLTNGYLSQDYSEAFRMARALVVGNLTDGEAAMRLLDRFGG